MVYGSRVLGLDKKIGTLEVGKQADVITVNLRKYELTPVISNPFSNIVPNLVYSTTGSEVDNVIINGQIIISDNEFTKINEQSIINEASIRCEKVCEKASKDWLKADSMIVKYLKEGLNSSNTNH